MTTTNEIEEEVEIEEVEVVKPKKKTTPKKKNKYTEEGLLEMTNKDLREICKKLEVKSSRVKEKTI